MSQVNDNSNKMNEYYQTTTKYCSSNGNTNDHSYSNVLNVASECTKTSEVAAAMTCMNTDENFSDDNVTNSLHLCKR